MNRRAGTGPIPAPASLSAAAAELRRGGIVAFPTETVYGLAVRMGDPAAAARLRRLKGRQPGKPLQVLVSSWRRALDLCGRPGPLARRLMERFWPGPLTLVVRARNGRWVGLRMPDHPVALSLVRRAGGAVRATSANLSGRPPARSAAQVRWTFGDRLTLVEGGPRPMGKPSTVVRVRDDTWELLRAGAISAPRVAKVAGAAARTTLS